MTLEDGKKLEEVFKVPSSNDTELWHSGGGCWILFITRKKDGHVIVVTDEVITEFDSLQAFYDNLNTGETDVNTARAIFTV